MKQISISQEPHEIHGMRYQEIPVCESCKDQCLQFQMFFQTKHYFFKT